MTQLYIKQCSYDRNSWSVFERGRTNEFGEPYCHAAAVTREQAEAIVKCPDCKGEGWISYRDEHNNTGFDDCKRCKTTGQINPQLSA